MKCQLQMFLNQKIQILIKKKHFLQILLIILIRVLGMLIFMEGEIIMKKEIKMYYLVRKIIINKWDKLLGLLIKNH